MALHSRRPPSLDRVPVSPVPRRPQYYDGATTSRTRIPGRLLASPPESTAHLLGSCLAAAIPRGRRRRAGQGHLFRRRPISGSPLRGRVRDLTGSLAIHPCAFAQVQDPGRTAALSPSLSIASVLPPPKGRRRLQRHKHIGATAGLQRLLPTLRGLCCQAQARLASGWLAHLFRAGVEPAGSLRKVSDHSHGLPPFQVLPCRYLRGFVVNLYNGTKSVWIHLG